MDLPRLLTKSLITELEKEMRSLDLLLDHYNDGKEGKHYEDGVSRAQVFNDVMQEHTLRYLALRGIYRTNVAQLLYFATEVNGGLGPVDLVLYENNGEQYAFELKRWKSGKEKSAVNEHDYEKLKNFVNTGANRHGYALIVTLNDHKDVPRAKIDPRGYYSSEFEEYFGEKYTLEGDPYWFQHADFTICCLLGGLK